jgi:hypothetical protein
MTAFEVRHYTVRLRHSRRLRYRVARLVWRGVLWLTRLVRATVRLALRLFVATAATVRAAGDRGGILVLRRLEALLRRFKPPGKARG